MGSDKSSVLLPTMTSFTARTCLMFFSLDRTMTKNQLLSTKFKPKYLAVVSIWKEKKTAWLLLFLILTAIKNFGEHLDFGYWPIQWNEQRKNCSQKKPQENRTEGGDISKIWSFLTTWIYYCTKDTFFSWSTDHYLFWVVDKLRL